eukprot:Anaeramoba_flamelloidesa93020_53.p1 GENE.a93020_53~~a93020_53.p1  ORF type:complete len:298 (-),score=70.84 a93020_53:138-1031(-)
MNKNYNTHESQIAHTFLDYFFKLLYNQPEKIYECYEPNSKLSIGNEEDNTLDIPSTGEQIEIKLEEQRYNKCETFISDVVCQDSINESVMINLIGWLTNGNEQPKKFCRSFLLQNSNQDEYFIRNDILRFLDLNFIPQQQMQYRRQQQQNYQDENYNYQDQNEGLGSGDEYTHTLSDPDEQLTSYQQRNKEIGRNYEPEQETNEWRYQDETRSDEDQYYRKVQKHSFDSQRESNSQQPVESSGKKNIKKTTTKKKGAGKGKKKGTTKKITKTKTKTINKTKQGKMRSPSHLGGGSIQ